MYENMFLSRNNALQILFYTFELRSKYGTILTISEIAEKLCSSLAKTQFCVFRGLSKAIGAMKSGKKDARVERYVASEEMYSTGFEVTS